MELGLALIWILLVVGAFVIVSSLAKIARGVERIANATEKNGKHDDLKRELEELKRKD